MLAFELQASKMQTTLVIANELPIGLIDAVKLILVRFRPEKYHRSLTCFAISTRVRDFGEQTANLFAYRSGSFTAYTGIGSSQAIFGT
jgi:hypothetical protein